MHVLCKFCNGSGKLTWRLIRITVNKKLIGRRIKLKNGTFRTCDFCNGRGYKLINTDELPEVILGR